MDQGNAMRRLIINADMQNYSTQDVPGQYEAQRTFSRVLTEASRHAGLDDAQWMSQRAGDSQLAILPADALEHAVVGAMAHRMNHLLRAHNRRLSESARVRVRMAVHEGVVHIGDNGFVSEAVNLTCHLCNADQVKTVLSFFPNANVALVVSDRIYQDVIAHEYEGIRKDRFRRFQIGLKHDLELETWISVIDEDVSRFSSDDDQERSRAARENDSTPDPADNTPLRTGDTWHFGEIRSSGPAAFGPHSTANHYGETRR